MDAQGIQVECRDVAMKANVLEISDLPERIEKLSGKPLFDYIHESP